MSATVQNNGHAGNTFSNSQFGKDIPRMESKHKLVGYVTDIEGNYDYWQRYIALSKVLFRNKQTLELDLVEDSELVFGGDVCDRGPGDIRVVRDLLYLKRKYPSRVHLILGNRDVNKLRVDIELQQCNLLAPGQVYWIDQPSEANQSAADRLKWIFLRTMGAPGTFEYRRKELIELGLPSTDEDVVESYKAWLSPTGEMVEFLALGQVAAIIGDTLFIHGALKPASVGWVPPRRGEASGGYCQANIREWVDHINSFVREEVRDYKKNIQAYMDAYRRLNRDSSISAIPYWAQEGGYNHSMPGSRLLQYGMGWMPDKSVNPTAMYSCYLNSASPTFTAKLVSKLTETAVEENEKRGQSPKVLFQRATRSAAALRRLQLSVSQNSIVHIPKTATLHSYSTDATVGIASIGSAREGEESPATTSGETDASTPKTPNGSGKDAVTGAGSGKTVKQEDQYPPLVSPWQRASDVAAASFTSSDAFDDEDGEHGRTVSTMQSCVNGLVSYLTMVVDGVVYTLFKDEHNSHPNTNMNYIAASEAKSTHSEEVEKRLAQERERDKDLLKHVRAIPPTGGIFAHVVKQQQQQQLEKQQSIRLEELASPAIDLSSVASPADKPDRLANLSTKTNNTSSTRSSKSSFGNSAFGMSALENESAEVQLNNYLLNSGIRNIVVGHQPRGDAPLILDTEDGLKVISADTSYAINTKWETTYRTVAIADDQNPNHNEIDNMPPPPSDSTRGITVCEVYLDICGSQTNVYLQGRLSNGLPYEFELGASDPDYVGRKTPKGWYVKASGVIAMEVAGEQINDPKSYFLLTQMDGFVVRNKLVPEEDIEKEFEPPTPKDE